MAVRGDPTIIINIRCFFGARLSCPNSCYAYEYIPSLQAVVSLRRQQQQQLAFSRKGQEEDSVKQKE